MRTTLNVYNSRNFAQEIGRSMMEEVGKPAGETVGKAVTGGSRKQAARGGEVTMVHGRGQLHPGLCGGCWLRHPITVLPNFVFLPWMERGQEPAGVGGRGLECSPGWEPLSLSTGQSRNGARGASTARSRHSI